MPSDSIGYTSQLSEFQSHGETCRGTLLRPDIPGPLPTVILAHGFAAERSFQLPEIARYFTEHGYATYYFDYRCFGDSDGQPRHWVDPRRHQQDWHNAIDHVSKLDGIDPTRLALWGSSFSGGHVLQLASEGLPIAAVMAQVPHINGIATARNIPLKNLLRMTVSGLADSIGSMVGYQHYSPVVGKPGDYATMTSEECWDGWFSIVPEHSQWQNKVLSRAFLKLPLYSPSRRAAKIHIPALIIAGKNDSITPAKTARNMAEEISQGEYHELPCNHFQVYTGEFLDRARAIQLAFLDKHLSGNSD